jgi:hypothetical protein
MKKVKVLKAPKKKVLRKKLPLCWLEKKARLSLESGQKYVYVRMIRKNSSLKYIYKIGFAYGKRLSCHHTKKNGRKMARSALCAAIIYRCYGSKVFEDFLEELKQNTMT